ncbi:hypothetical protein CUMW_169700, partial [Citrus unshiu]
FTIVHKLIFATGSWSHLLPGVIRIMTFSFFSFFLQTFLRSGMYIVLKKVDLQVHSSRKYFGLFNFIYSLSCYIIRKQKDPSKAHQTKLDVIVKALKWLEMDMDVDEDPFPILNGKPVNSCRSFVGDGEMVI